MGKWFLFSIMIGQSLVEVNAASENAQFRSGQMIEMQGGTKVIASGWAQTIPMASRQQEGKDRKEMQKESRMVRCTEKKHMRWYKGNFLISSSELNTE